jgi:hypothetical protein
MAARDTPTPLASEVSFDDAHRALLVSASAGSNAASLVDALQLRHPRPVIVVIGGATGLDTKSAASAATALRGVAPGVVSAAANSGAAIVDGGTDAGLMAIMGSALAAAGVDVPLLGVAPAGRVLLPGQRLGSGEVAETDGAVELQRNHSHFILADANEWGGETPLLIESAAALAGGAQVAVVVAAGGRVTQAEVAAAAARGWPIFVIGGTGGVAQRLAAAATRRRRPWQRRTLRSLVGPGADVRVVDAAGGASGELARVLGWQLTPAPTLKLAWQRFCVLDREASRLRRVFERTQVAIIALGVLVTLLAVLRTVSHDSLVSADNAPPYGEVIDGVLHWSVLSLPVLASALIAMSNRFANGRRWILVRSAAEEVKREIFTYRTRCSYYSGAATQRRKDARTAEQLLARRVATAERRLLTGEARLGAFGLGNENSPPDGLAAGDDGLSRLDGGRYIEIRTSDQLRYFQARTATLTRRLRGLQTVAILVAGSATVLAAAGLEAWVGLATVLAAGVMAYLGYAQIEPKLMSYNVTALELSAAAADWSASPVHEQVQLERLVTVVETSLAAERSGWLRHMSDSLEDLRGQQDPTIDITGTVSERAAGGPTSVTRP